MLGHVNAHAELVHHIYNEKDIQLKGHLGIEESLKLQAHIFPST